MAVSIDSRIWLAAHLLYPNSSQAFDVYQTLISQTDVATKKNNINFTFQKLFQIVEKISAISSNKPFNVFEEEKTEQWKQIYKKSQKEQLIIFIGYFVFDINLKDISGILKMSSEKAQFLFHQVFRKAVFSNIKIDVADKIELKKYSEEKVSYLFTNENLINYCLQNLSDVDMGKVKLGLQLYPELQASQKQFDLIVAQMQYLNDSQADRVTKTLIQTSEPLSEPRESFQVGTLFVKNKKLLLSLTVSALCLFLVILRPQWIQHLSESERDHFVDLQEVKPIQHESELAPPKPEPAKPSVAEVVAPMGASKDQTKPAVVAAATPPRPTEVKPKVEEPSSQPVPEEPEQPVVPTEAKPTQVATQTAHEPMAQPKKSGGLYRGVLVVTDINETTDKITQKLVDIGGKKAGEVELGWRKTEKLSYYHFTLPENNVEAIKQFLTQFGSLQIQFENHPRLMPAGVKRLIIEVKERE